MIYPAMVVTMIQSRSEILTHIVRGKSDRRISRKINHGRDLSRELCRGLNSPADPSPIENLWAILQASVDEERLLNQEELISVTTSAQYKSPRTIVNSVVDSITRRIQTICNKESGRIGH
jgi:hypothetical protein